VVIGYKADEESKLKELKSKLGARHKVVFKSDIKFVAIDNLF